MINTFFEQSFEKNYKTDELSIRLIKKKERAKLYKKWERYITKDKESIRKIIKANCNAGATNLKI